MARKELNKCFPDPGAIVVWKPSKQDIEEAQGRYDFDPPNVGICVSADHSSHCATVLWSKPVRMTGDVLQVIAWAFFVDRAHPLYTMRM